MIPRPTEPYVVRAKCGRDRKRLFLVLGAAETPYPAVYVANGTLHPLEKPKIKNIAHLTWLAPLSATEKASLCSCYTNENIAKILRIYEQNGENAKNLAKDENPA